MSVTTFTVDSAFVYIAAFSFLLFFIIVFLMVYFAVRYRKSRNPVPADISGNTFLEILWVAAPTLLVLTMFVYGLTGFSFLRHPPADSMHVKVISRQWSWRFQYDNGALSPVLNAPIGRDVRLELTSVDVIHGFFVPAFRIKQDAVPGLTTQAWFKAETTGSFDILCTQYCGTGHSAMLAKLNVMPQDQFDQWYASAAPPPAPGGTQGTAPAPPPSTAPQPAAPPAVPPGEQLLDSLGCISCHSTDGSPIVGPTFKGLYGSPVDVTTDGAKRTVTADDAYITRSILTPGADVVVGFQNIMPPYQGRITDAQIAEVIAYLKTLK